MERWVLKIKLESSLCTATGEDAPGITNIMTATEDGIPYIPAKRIKGCLLESGKEMRDNGLIGADVLEGIFGRKGARTGEGICIGDAHISLIPRYLFDAQEEDSQEDTQKKDSIIENYEHFQSEVHKRPEMEKAYLEEFFTRQRTRTAIDADTGTAEDHSLRTMQVVPKGIEFVSYIEGDLSRKEKEALENCVKGLRHMGMGITRGFGEVRCTLETAKTEKLERKEISGCTKASEEALQSYGEEEEVELSYEIKLDSPIALDGNEDCLPAGPVLGALAGMYIRKFSLGSDAHKDQNFSRIFLHDGVQFGYGFLKRNGQVYWPCPKAIAEEKENRGKWFQIAEGNENRRRREISGQVYWKNHELHTISARRELHFHHARPLDRGIAHALNDRAEDTSVDTGQFFQYTALSKGQVYAGTWLGKAGDLKRLAACQKENDYQMKLGRSKTAEYGRCTFVITGVSPKNNKQESVCQGKKWLLWLLTPMVSRDRETGEYTLAEKAFKEQLEEILGCKVQGLKMAAGGYTTHSGYNSRWRMPLVSCPAIAAGSTFILETDQEVYQHQIESIRWGELTGRGYGQVAVRPFDNKEVGEIVRDSEEENTEKNQGAESHEEERNKAILHDILSNQSKRLEDRKAILDRVDIIGKDELPPSSAISMLSRLLRSYEKDKDFYQKIVNEVGNIHDEEKKKRILKIIGHCKNKSYDFTKRYLENAKWKARGRDES